MQPSRLLHEALAGVPQSSLQWLETARRGLIALDPDFWSAFAEDRLAVAQLPDPAVDRAGYKRRDAMLADARGIFAQSLPTPLVALPAIEAVLLGRAEGPVDFRRFAEAVVDLWHRTMVS